MRSRARKQILVVMWTRPCLCPDASLCTMVCGSDVPVPILLLRTTHSRDDVPSATSLPSKVLEACRKETLQRNWQCPRPRVAAIRAGRVGLRGGGPREGDVQMEAVTWRETQRLPRALLAPVVSRWLFSRKSTLLLWSKVQPGGAGVAGCLLLQKPRPTLWLCLCCLNLYKGLRHHPTAKRQPPCLCFSSKYALPAQAF